MDMEIDTFSQKRKAAATPLPPSPKQTRKASAKATEKKEIKRLEKEYAAQQRAAKIVARDEKAEMEYLRKLENKKAKEMAKAEKKPRKPASEETKAKRLAALEKARAAKAAKKMGAAAPAPAPAPAPAQPKAKASPEEVHAKRLAALEKARAARAAKKAAPAAPAIKPVVRKTLKKVVKQEAEKVAEKVSDIAGGLSKKKIDKIEHVVEGAMDPFDGPVVKTVAKAMKHQFDDLDASVEAQYIRRSKMTPLQIAKEDLKEAELMVKATEAGHPVTGKLHASYSAKAEELRKLIASLK